MNMLAFELPGSHWLDLFCGSGVMGCEALHHGAAAVVAVDQQRAMAATARANLELVASGLQAKPAVQVILQEVVRWLQQGRPASMPPFGLIYADPPYAAGLYEPIAEAIVQGGWLADNGTLLLECSTTAIPVISAQSWELAKQKRYGSSTILVLRRS